jgi:UDP-glucose 4-epimerase
MNVLVTGGAGFIGSHTVVELANAGFNPIIVDDLSNSDQSVLSGLRHILGYDVPFFKADCNVLSDLQAVVDKFHVEGIIHFAAFKSVGESVIKPLKYYKNNINSLITVLELMQANAISNLVFSSSCTVYGEPDQVPVTENTPRKKAESPYGNTKTFGEDIMEDAAKADQQLKLVSLRYFNPIGAHHSAEIGELPNGVPSNLVPFITQTAIGKREKLTVFGDDYNTPDGSNVRDFIHVVDLAKAHVAALKLLAKKNGGYYDVFNIGTGKGNSVLELIQAFENVNQLALNYEIGNRRAGDIEKIFGDVKKAEKEMNWRAEKNIEEGLKDAWAWEQKLKIRNK